MQSIIEPYIQDGKYQIHSMSANLSCNGDVHEFVELYISSDCQSIFVKTIRHYVNPYCHDYTYTDTYSLIDFLYLYKNSKRLIEVDSHRDMYDWLIQEKDGGGPDLFVIELYEMFGKFLTDPKRYVLERRKGGKVN